MLSTWQKIERVLGLKDGDLTEWERSFMKTLHDKQKASVGQVVELSDKQVVALDRIHDKHFAS